MAFCNTMAVVQAQLPEVLGTTAVVTIVEAPTSSSTSVSNRDLPSLLDLSPFKPSLPHLSWFQLESRLDTARTQAVVHAAACAEYTTECYSAIIYRLHKS